MSVFLFKQTFNVVDDFVYVRIKKLMNDISNCLTKFSRKPLMQQYSNINSICKR